MGVWEEFNPEPRPRPVHEHDKPNIPYRGAQPGRGSVWRCRCGATWEVIKLKPGKEVPEYAMHSWENKGGTYYLSSFNYDQASPFGGSC